ncbi:hypothetical protein V6N11_025113 [Hibiscus sabdariffa]|uniref:F-box domain-containing protein n=1 Tax=Hibiscus sabdariffa TaxID=183260 RepID=A0ABR2QPC7_9ROSI
MATLSVPHDIVSEILHRLGVNDLLRFKCVSKAWCSLIDDPDFAKLHLSHSLKAGTNLSLVPRGLDGGLLSVELHSLKRVRRLKHPLESYHDKFADLLGSCNGLLALMSRRDEISLWNPSTRKSRMFPAAAVEISRGRLRRGFVVYGFGYDRISDDYKLLQMAQYYFSNDDSIKSEVKVYSSSSNCWRRIQDFNFYIKYKLVHGVLANNALHFVVSRMRRSEPLVAAFDLGTEEFRLLELPDCLGTGFSLNVRALGGYLSLTVSYYLGVHVWDVHDTEIWVMKEYGVRESWTKLISIKQSEFILGFNYVLPLAFSNNADKVLLYVDRNKFMWYDLRSRRVENERDLGGVPRFQGVEMLVVSLVAL